MTLAGTYRENVGRRVQEVGFRQHREIRTDQGNVYIDGMQNPPSVSNDDKAADCTIKMISATWPTWSAASSTA